VAEVTESTPPPSAVDEAAVTSSVAVEGAGGEVDSEGGTLEVSSVFGAVSSGLSRHVSAAAAASLSGSWRISPTACQQGRSEQTHSMDRDRACRMTDLQGECSYLQTTRGREHLFSITPQKSH